MSIAVLHSRSLDGLHADPVAVEVHIANGLPCFTLVGLPDTEVKEARDRVRAAIQSSGFDFPARRVTVNLAPADLPKGSGRFDLPIALGILVASGQLPATELADYEWAGELALTGALRPVRGALAMTFHATSQGRRFVLPLDCADEAALVEHAEIYPASSLLAVVDHLTGRQRLIRHRAQVQVQPVPYPDLLDVKGQAGARRALEVAAAGGHNLLLVGPPGTGKSMLASRLPGILPPMTLPEALESAAVQSLSRRGFQLKHWRTRPFRTPHHSASAAALVGGGSDPKPGEISLAHHGVLFLDELTEFERPVLEVLREPLETGMIHISRAARQASYPARFQLVAAMNPCPCGHFGNPQGQCRCTPDQVARYRGKLSAPFLDRIDLHVAVPALPQQVLLGQARSEASAPVRARVDAAFARQMARQGIPNAHLDTAAVERHCPTDPAASQLLAQALRTLGLSARGFHRVLKVARTIADLDSTPLIGHSHVAEAISYRRLLASLGSWA